MSNASEMVRFFAECDARAAVPLTAAEAARLADLAAKARTVGLGGNERVEWLRLDQRRNAR